MARHALVFASKDIDDEATRYAMRGLITQNSQDVAFAVYNTVEVRGGFMRNFGEEVG